MSSEFRSPFKARDRVIIDGDESIVALVTAFSFRPIPFDHSSIYTTIECSYMHNGVNYTVFVEPDRLTLAREK